MEMDILQCMANTIWRNRQCHMNKEDRPIYLPKGRDGDIRAVHTAEDIELVPEN